MGIHFSLNKILDLLSKHLPSNALRIGCQRAKGVRIGDNVYLAYDVNIDLVCPELIWIGDHVRIGIGVIILAHNRPSDAWLPYLGQVQERVRIESNAVIAAGAIILPGVTVGECAIVREGTVVDKDVAPFSVVIGNPAQVVETLLPDKVPRDLLEQTRASP